MHIEIREYLESRPDGDRATKLSDSSLFHVVLVKDDKREVVLNKFDQFDAYNTIVLPRKDVEPKCRKYTNKIADALEIPVVYRRFTEQRVERVDWVEVTNA